nr:MAG: BRO-C protein [Apis mellifera filamentous virus]
MDTKVHKIEDKEITVSSCLTSDNIRFYYLNPFTTFFKITNFAKIVNRLKSKQNNNRRLLRYIFEFEIRSQLRRTTVFVSALGLKDVILSLQDEKRYHYWEFVQSILRDYDEVLPKRLGMFITKLNFEGFSFDFVRIFGDDIEDFFYLFPLSQALEYVNVFTSVSQLVSPENIRHFVSLQADYVVNLDADTRVPPIPSRSLFINFNGFNELTLGSKLPRAKRFRKWLIGVLVQLRLQGNDMSHDVPTNSQQDIVTNSVFGQTISSVISIIQKRLDEQEKQLTEQENRLNERLEERLDERLREQEERSNQRVEEHLNQCVKKINQSIEHTNKEIDYHNQHVRQRVTHEVPYNIFVLLSILVMPKNIRFSITRGRDQYVQQIESKRKKFVTACRTNPTLLSSRRAKRHLFITFKKYKTANATVSWNNIRFAQADFLDNVRFVNRCQTVFIPLNLQSTAIDPLFTDRQDMEQQNDNFVYNRNSLNWLDPVLRDYKDKIVRFCDEAFRNLNRETNLSRITSLPMLNSNIESGPNNTEQESNHTELEVSSTFGTSSAPGPSSVLES